LSSLDISCIIWGIFSRQSNFWQRRKSQNPLFITTTSITIAEMVLGSSNLVEQSAQWLFPDEEMASTPSVLDGITPGEEARNRFSGCRFITDVGRMLQL
jgi:hypothetical protein